jgi:hypothetical protein
MFSKSHVPEFDLEWWVYCYLYLCQPVPCIGAVKNGKPNYYIEADASVKAIDTEFQL